MRTFIRAAIASAGLVVIGTVTTGVSASADGATISQCAGIEAAGTYTGIAYTEGFLDAGDVVSGVGTEPMAGATQLNMGANGSFLDSDPFVDDTATVSYTIPTAGYYYIRMEASPWPGFAYITLHCLAADTDADDDGVADADDVCADTVLPDVIPEPKSNRYGADADGVFGDSGYTIADTGGCSATQIIAAAGLGSGHTRYGITRSALDTWVASLA